MKEINAKRKAFREELTKIMPGYKWTVHKGAARPDWIYCSATGIKSAGLTRMSTLRVERTERGYRVEYRAKSSGYGVQSPWLHSTTAPTLARVLRQLQDWYMRQAGIYTDAAEHLKQAREEIEI